MRWIGLLLLGIGVGGIGCGSSDEKEELPPLEELTRASCGRPASAGLLGIPAVARHVGNECGDIAYADVNGMLRVRRSDGEIREVGMVAGREDALLAIDETGELVAFERADGMTGIVDIGGASNRELFVAGQVAKAGFLTSWKGQTIPFVVSQTLGISFIDRTSGAVRVVNGLEGAAYAHHSQRGRTIALNHSGSLVLVNAESERLVRTSLVGGPASDVVVRVIDDGSMILHQPHRFTNASDACCAVVGTLSILDSSGKAVRTFEPPAQLRAADGADLAGYFVGVGLSIDVRARRIAQISTGDVQLVDPSGRVVLVRRPPNAPTPTTFATSLPIGVEAPPPTTGIDLENGPTLVNSTGVYVLNGTLARKTFDGRPPTSYPIVGISNPGGAVALENGGAVFFGIAQSGGKNLYAISSTGELRVVTSREIDRDREEVIRLDANRAVVTIGKIGFVVDSETGTAVERWSDVDPIAITAVVSRGILRLPFTQITSTGLLHGIP